MPAARRILQFLSWSPTDLETAHAAVCRLAGAKLRVVTEEYLQAVGKVCCHACSKFCKVATEDVPLAHKRSADDARELRIDQPLILQHLMRPATLDVRGDNTATGLELLEEPRA